MKIFITIIVAILFQGCGGKPGEIKKVKIGDSELAYAIRGQGEPLVMIMGFRGTMGIWDPALLALLEKKFTLILFDNRGAGFSTDLSTEPLTITQMAEDTAQLIEALGYEKAHVLGWSMGSRIALELALHHPEKVQSLILCSPNPGGDYQARRKTDAYKTLTAKKLSNEEGLALIFPEKADAEAFVARLTASAITGSTPEDYQVSEKTVARQVEALKAWDENNHMYNALPNIKSPTLVAGGLSDALDAPDNIQRVAGRIPFAWSAYFPGAGHAFLFQDHARFADLAILFIETANQ